MTLSRLAVLDGKLNPAPWTVCSAPHTKEVCLELKMPPGRHRRARGILDETTSQALNFVCGIEQSQVVQADTLFKRLSLRASLNFVWRVTPVAALH